MALEVPFSSTPSANLFPKVSSPFCRLPSPGFILHWSETAHFGYLMRFPVRLFSLPPVAFSLPRIFKEKTSKTRCDWCVNRTFRDCAPLRRITLIHGARESWGFRVASYPPPPPSSSLIKKRKLFLVLCLFSSSFFFSFFFFVADCSTLVSS